MNSPSSKIIQHLQSTSSQIQTEILNLLRRFGSQVSASIVFEVTATEEGLQFSSLTDCDFNITPTRKLGMGRMVVMITEQKIVDQMKSLLPMAIIPPTQEAQ